MKPPTKKAMKLFRDNFTHYSGVHTDQGTMPLWGQLVRAGFVKPMTSIMGHDFNYEITPEGKEAIKQDS